MFVRISRAIHCFFFPISWLSLIKTNARTKLDLNYCARENVHQEQAYSSWNAQRWSPITLDWALTNCCCRMFMCVNENMLRRGAELKMWGQNNDDKHNARTRKRSRPMSHISTATLRPAPPGCRFVAAVLTGVAAAIQPSQSCEFSCIVRISSFSGKKRGFGPLDCVGKEVKVLFFSGFLYDALDQVQ